LCLCPLTKTATYDQIIDEQYRDQIKNLKRKCDEVNICMEIEKEGFISTPSTLDRNSFISVDFLLKSRKSIEINLEEERILIKQI